MTVFLFMYSPEAIWIKCFWIIPVVNVMVDTIHRNKNIVATAEFSTVYNTIFIAGSQKDKCWGKIKKGNRLNDILAMQIS